MIHKFEGQSMNCYSKQAHYPHVMSLYKGGSCVGGVPLQKFCCGKGSHFEVIKDVDGSPEVPCLLEWDDSEELYN